MAALTCLKSAHPGVRRLLYTALALLAALGTASAEDVPASSVADAKPCWIKGVPQQASCGSLRRPLDPEDPRSPSIEVHFVIVGAQARNKKPDPIFYFAGGPGQSAISLAGPVSQAMAPILNRRDLILIDQRGTGRSAPLSCDAPQGLESRSKTLERLAHCRRALQALPYGDLRQYSTSAAVQDTDAVRIALGADRINLVGSSYGSRMVLEYMRRFPQASRRAVIDGPAPPDMVLPLSAASDANGALQAVWRHCQAEAACAQSYPDLRRRVAALLASLPRKMSVRDPDTGLDQFITMEPETLLGLLRAPLFVPALTAGLPAAAHAAASGDLAPLLALARVVQQSTGTSPLSEGLHYSVVCSEDVPLMPAAPATPNSGVELAIGEFYKDVCSQWPRATLEASFRKLSQTSTPTLILAGGADPATPPRHGRRLVQALGRMARLVVVEHAGHGVMFSGCAPEILHRFIDATGWTESTPLNTDCIRNIPRPPSFHLPRPGHSP